MAKEIRLPQLGQTMEEGTIISCMVSVGDVMVLLPKNCIFQTQTQKFS